MFFFAVLPSGLETPQRILHPPACSTSYTNPTYSLSESIIQSISFFPLTFFYVPFCSSVTPFMPHSLFFQFSYHCCSCIIAFMVIFAMLRLSLCLISEFYSPNLFTDVLAFACMCSSYQNDPSQSYKSWLHTYNNHVYLILYSLFSTDFDVTNDYCSQGQLCPKTLPNSATRILA